MTAEPIRVLVVDHNPLMREGLALLVRLNNDMHLTGMAASAVEAAAMYLEQRPDVMVLDLDLPARAAFHALHDIFAFDPQARVIGIATYREEAVWREARGAGIRSCAAKDELSATLPGLIRASN